MVYMLLLIAFVAFELLYFRLADRFNIIDKPNERSSHTDITLRGGGIVFYFAALVYFVVSGFDYHWFFLGLTLMTVISFADDILTLSNKIRLAVHFISVFLMAYELQIFNMPWIYLPLTFIFVVGVINAYNFMDGINGITAAYSLSVAGLLWLVNREVNFIEEDFLIYAILGVLAFSFFNFRIKAKCFAGDVGSVAIAYILLFALGLLIVKTENLLYILFLSVYGLDAIWTIIRRIYLKENIFKAHRSHLYQYLVNEVKVNRLIVSSAYGLLQVVIGIAVVYVAKLEFTTQIWFAISLLICLSTIYITAKQMIINRYVSPALIK